MPAPGLAVLPWHLSLPSRCQQDVPAPASAARPQRRNRRAALNQPPNQREKSTEREKPAF